MGRIKSLVRNVWGNPVACAVIALVLFGMSVGGMALAGYADQYVNGGVTWGPLPAEAPKIQYADVNPMGVNLALEKEVDPAKIERTLQMVQDGGFKWARQGFAWNDIEISAKGNYTDTRNPGLVVNAWDKYDRMVDAYQRHGIEVIARLDSPPVWARMPGDDVEQFRKGPPAHNEDFGDFAYEVASRYKGYVKYFQIWNEPNLWGEWGGHAVNAEEYTALLKVAYTRIKEANPEAVVITAALAPTADNSIRNLNDVLYLEWMYRAGAAPYFDILSTMLYGLGQSPEERRTDLKRLNFSRPILLRQVMEKNGDAHKPIWISEYAWISLPPDFKGDPGRNIWGESVDEETQARYLVEGYERAQKEWPWMGVMNVWYFREPDPDPLDPADYFAIVRPDFTPRPAYEALKRYGESKKEYVPVSTPLVEKQELRPWMGDAAIYFLVDTVRFTGNRLDCDCGVDFFGVETLDDGTVTTEQRATWLIGPRDSEGRNLIWGVPYGTHTAVARRTIEQHNREVKPPKYTAFREEWRLESPPEKPLWNAWGIPILYGFFGLLAIGSAGLGGVSLGRWAQAALDRPRGKFSEEMKELARNGAAVVGMALAIGVWYRAGSLPLMAVGLGAWWGIAMLKPSLGLAVVAFSIPFFWVQKVVGQQHFPPEETLLVLLFAAVIARGALRFLFPQLPIFEPQRHKEQQEDKEVIGVEPQRRGDAEVVEREEASGGGPAREGVINHAPTWRAWRAWRERFRAWNVEDPLGVAGVALVLVATLSLFTLADPAYARDSFRLYRWAIVLPVLLYFLMTDVLRSRRGLLRVADFFVAGAVIVSLVGLWQFAQDTNVLDVQGVSRIKSVYQHPNNLALYLGRVAPFVGCMALFLPKGRRKGLYGLAMLPVLATLILTFSRGAWVAVVAAMFAAVWVAWRFGGAGASRVSLLTRVPRRVWVGVVVGLVVLMVGAAVAIVPNLPPRIFAAQSLSMRVLHWWSAVKMIRDHPVTGVGIDQFLNQFELPDYRYREIEQDREFYTAHPHNFVLDFWVSLGIMGVIVLIWLLWKYFRVAVARVKEAAHDGDKVKRAISLGLLASMVVFLVHGMVDNSYFLMDLASVFWLSCGMLQVLKVAPD